MPDFIDDLTGSYEWGDTEITYTFDKLFYDNQSGVQSTFANEIAGSVSNGDSIKGGAALTAWGKVAPFEFTQLDSTSADIAILKAEEVIDDQDLPEGFSTIGVTRGTQFLGNFIYQAAFHEPSVTLETYIHELGHALGLDHPGHGSGFAGGYTKDTTIMSYNIGSVVEGRAIITPMIYDIAAIQSIYGVTSYNPGDTNYGVSFLNGESRAWTIWDADGDDTIDASGIEGNHIIDLRGGLDDEGDVRFSEIADERVAIALDPGTSWTKPIIIESAVTGDGDDTIYGNEADNTLDGGDGNDSYIFNSEDSEGDADTVIDSDGIGVLIFDGVSITGTAEEEVIDEPGLLPDTETFTLEAGGIAFYCRYGELGGILIGNFNQDLATRFA